MKLFKKAALLCASLLACIGFAVAGVACVENNPSTSTPPNSSDQTSSPDEDVNPSEYVYCINVQNATGFGFDKVVVKLMNGTEEVISGKTNSSGKFYIEEEDEVPVGNYDIVLENIPNGYVVETAGKTVSLAGTTATTVIKPNGVIAGSAPQGTLYKLGDVVYDFSVTTSDGGTFTVSEILKTKDFVVVNFWATWCTPCKQEFPALNSAYIAYQDVMDCVAISTTDSLSAAGTFKSSEGLSFKFSGGTNIPTLFGVSSIPHTVIIDRFGAIVFNEVGSITSVNQWSVLFDNFIGEDYVPFIKGAASEDDSTGDSGSGQVEYIKPTVDAPSFSAVQSAMNTQDGEFKYRWQKDGVKEGDKDYDPYNWPWVVQQDAGTTYLAASNVKVHPSYAILYADYTAHAGDVIAFDYKVGSEELADYFYVLVNGTIVKQISGNHTKAWQVCYAYVFEEYEEGETEIAFVFIKDGSISVYEDVAQIKNLRVVSISDIPHDAGENAQVFRQAATVLNTDENATTQYKNYVSVAMSNTDNYYRVDLNKNGEGEADEPLLFATLYYASLWNNATAADLAASGYFVSEGFDFYDALTTYMWTASQPIEYSGYVPVNEELRSLLELMVESITYGQKWNGKTHENEWLELCCYYQHYGDEPFADNTLGISFDSAIEIGVGTNHVNVPFAIVPRGFKHKFVPEQSGIYRVYSVGEVDTLMFLFADDRETILGEYDDRTFTSTVGDYNFEFYYRFEAGKTYYMLFHTATNISAQYDVVIEYAGTERTELTNVATTLSQNPSTGETFVMNAKEYALGDDGVYHIVNSDGSLGSKIYLDTAHTTYLFSYSLQGRINAFKELDDKGQWTGEWTAPPQDRPYYIAGVDYTEILEEYCFKASKNTGELKGFIEVDEELLQILIAVTESEEYDCPPNSWQMMCYYYTTIKM